MKTGYFVLEGLNSFATVFYFYYFYFFMQQAFGFGNRANLLLAALSGAVYAGVVWQAGKFAQRFGYFTALKLGFAIMLVSMSLGLWSATALGHIVAMAVTVVGMSFTWPTLEALTSEGETRAGLQHMVGIYNVVWASTAALANFTGGAMLEKLGLKSLFYVPAAIQLVQIGLTFWLASKSRPSTPKAAARAAIAIPPASFPAPGHPSQVTEHEARNTPSATPIPRARTFLRMAWLANPFAYIAINTLIAVIPGVARRLELSTMLAGFCCSVWCFARMGAFVALWLWDDWHYRFRWLLAAFLALVGAFAAILMAPNVPVLVLAQIVFGGAAGLIYYSSLFYSMDIGESKGEHGGIHEAAIGLGNFAGPAFGAASLSLLPQYAHSGTVAVTVLLLCGLGALLAIWQQGRRCQMIPLGGDEVLGKDETRTGMTNRE